ncbi:ATP-binding protein [Falsiroseomonas sp. E2-1-a4]|uniref:ATP-binding protein n=1 Tax=Falsiroseomonas sp. E2-1-a4 TaxID=3239299 RepID=UPI003F40620C
MTPSAQQHLDALLAQEVRRLRARYALSQEEFRGLFISDAQVDALLHGGAPPPPLLCRDWRQDLPELAARFALEPLECGCVVLALAPEVAPRYATLYAYLNDDVSRRWPTLDLAQRLLGEVRAALTGESRLASAGLIVPAETADAARPLCARGFRLSPLLLHHLLRLPGCAVPGLAWLAEAQAEATDEAPPQALLLAGPPETGRRAAAAAWAARLGRRALSIDLSMAGLEDAALAARLENAPLVILADAVAPPARLPARLDGWPLAMICRNGAPWRPLLRGRQWQEVTLAVPDAAARIVAWRQALKARGTTAPPAALVAAAGQFKLSRPAIARAAGQLPLGRVSAAEVTRAAGRELSFDFGPAARPVTLQPGWDDLVLTVGALEQLRDFAGAIAARATVFGQWGFGQVGRRTGEGLTAMFSGGSGTGKTMSAAVIARELGLALWRIDLSGLVSKFIGETERNLEQLFSASGASDAILFFDEADAIFGKRSEVKDSHDRYANIEIAYLLQRLEEHDGVVILATNLSRNLDAAFLRRIPFVIDFPMPDAAARTRLWRKAIPAAAPVSVDVDFALLGRHFDLSGGDIRAAALEAAFLAVRRNRPIGRPELETAVGRQMLKRGMLPARLNGAHPHPGRPA